MKLSLLVALLWGVWGALIEIPEKHFQPGFPATLGYVVWSLTMLPCAAVALWRRGWKLDARPAALLNGALVGLTGAAGQLALFVALRHGPAYLIFPIISMAPVVTIILSLLILRERANWMSTLGIAFSLVAIMLLSVQTPEPGRPVAGYAWLLGTFFTFAAWGVQGFVAKASTAAVDEDSLFFYMALSGVILAPVAWLMTDRSIPVNWGLTGPGLTAAIQLLNSLGALLFIYAMRSGKAIVVSPAINGLFPVITIVLSLLIYARWPERWNAIGMVVALSAIIVMSCGEATQSEVSAPNPEVR